MTTQSVTKQELPKYAAEQLPMYQIDSLRRDINKKLFGKADILIDKTLSCSRVKLSNSQTLNLDVVDTGVLISDFTQHLRPKNVDVVYFTRRCWNITSSRFSTRMPKLMLEEAGSLSRYERQKLQRLYTQGAAASGSIRNLATASRLPVSKVRRSLYSKASYTNFVKATRKFERMRAFARFRNETWCMDLAYVDKLAREKRCKVFTCSSKFV